MGRATFNPSHSSLPFFNVGGVTNDEARMVADAIRARADQMQRGPFPEIGKAMRLHDIAAAIEAKLPENQAYEA